MPLSDATIGEVSIYSGTTMLGTVTQRGAVFVAELATGEEVGAFPHSRDAADAIHAAARSRRPAAPTAEV